MANDKGIFRDDHLRGAAVGSLLTNAAIFMPYGAIADMVSRGIGFEYLVAIGLVAASAFVPFVGHRRSRSTHERVIGSSTERILSARPLEWIGKTGVLSMSPDHEANVAHLEETMQVGFRRTLVGGWRSLLLTTIAAHGHGELVHGHRPVRVLDEMRKVAQDAREGDLKASLDRLADVYSAIGAGCPRTQAYLKDIGERHSTMESVFLAALDLARSKRPLPTGLFPWLKQVDRPLWYALNNLGRTAFHVEGIAAIAHYRAEVAAGTALEVPQVRAAAAPLAAIAAELTAPVGREAA